MSGDDQDIPKPPEEFAAYPRPGYAPDHRNWIRPATLSLEVISQSWTLIQEQLATWALATLVACLIFGSCYALILGLVLGGLFGAGLFVPQEPPSDLGTIFGFLGLELLGIAILTTVQYLLMAGLFRMALKQLKGDQIEVLDLFRWEARFSQILLATVAVSGSILVGTIACFLPGFIAMGLLMMTFPLILDRKMDALSAMQLSYETLKPQLWMAALVAFVLQLVASIGIYLCGVGILVSAPLAVMSVALIYRNFFWRPPQQPETAWPPSEGSTR